MNQTIDQPLSEAWDEFHQMRYDDATFAEQYSESEFYKWMDDMRIAY